MSEENTTQTAQVTIGTQSFTITIGARTKRGSEGTEKESIALLTLDADNDEKALHALVTFVKAVGPKRFVNKLNSELMRPFSYDASDEARETQEDGSISLVPIKFGKEFESQFDPTSRQGGMKKRDLEQRMIKLSVEMLPLVNAFKSGQPIHPEDKAMLMRLAADIESTQRLLAKYDVKAAKTRATRVAKGTLVG